MKRLIHNRDAETRGFHKIEKIKDDDNTIRCSLCPWESALGQLSIWLDRKRPHAMCHGPGDREANKLRKQRLETVRLHNQSQGSPEQHMLDFDVDKDESRCTTCGESLPATTHTTSDGIYQMTHEACVATLSGEKKVRVVASRVRRYNKE